MAGQGGRKDPPGIGHQTVVIKGDLDAVGVLQWWHPLGVPGLGSVLCFQNHYPRSTGALCYPFSARWTTRIGMGEQLITTKTLRRRFFSLAGRLTHKARRLTLHLPQDWPWQNQFSSALARLRALPLPS